jgi:hypothetical protein
MGLEREFGWAEIDVWLPSGIYAMLRMDSFMLPEMEREA